MSDSITIHGKQPARIIIAGGGTGGHIFPAVAIANAIKKIQPGTEILFIGAKNKMEMEKIPEAGYRIEGIDIAGFNRSSMLKNVGLPLKLIKSFLQVARIVTRYKPTAVLGVGGYSSFPVLRYAQSKGIPTFIHESNSFAGKSNIMLGRKATMIFTAAEGMEKFFPASKIVVTGNPVRQRIANAVIPKEKALEFFGFNNDKKTVFSVGGSLGAVSINEALKNGLEVFDENNWQLIWQTGKTYFPTAEMAATGHKNLKVLPFISEMENAYAAADVIISRSGAMAIAEICVVKKPAIFVPYPHAAEDHQTANAMKLVQKKAALLVKDSEAGSQLLPALKNLMNDKTQQDEILKNLSGMGITDADDIIANKILNYTA
ncbi:MAG: undecaprenyldiphospho-muramoylpentapeptide beta-N-acetylglucosaminyltransferase [Ferruginibacter sp.]